MREFLHYPFSLGLLGIICIFDSPAHDFAGTIGYFDIINLDFFNL